jgi:hypothetical protein
VAGREGGSRRRCKITPSVSKMKRGEGSQRGIILLRGMEVARGDFAPYADVSSAVHGMAAAMAGLRQRRR